MKHWPKRVAAEVDILYADHGRVWRKYDSTSFGHAVSIGHSFKGAQVDFFDWCMEAEAIMSNICDAASWEAAAKDDDKASVDALENAADDDGEALSSSVLRLLQMEDSKGHDDTPSTSAIGSHDLDCSGAADRCSDDVGSSEAESELDLFAASDVNLAQGEWQGQKGSSYSISRSTNKGQGDWICWRQDVNGSSKSFKLFYDWDYDLIWWGAAGTYFASATELEEHPESLRWYANTDEQMSKPKITWALSDGASPSKPNRLAQRALQEIVASLKSSDNDEGYVWIEGWNERYGKRGLGQLKSFLEKHPDKFRVKSERGKAFSVTLMKPGSARRGTSDECSTISEEQ